MVRATGAITPALGTEGWNPELVLLNTWQLLSGYAHARPWAYSLGTRMVVNDPEPDPVTGTIRMTANTHQETARCTHVSDSFPTSLSSYSLLLNFANDSLTLEGQRRDGRRTHG